MLAYTSQPETDAANLLQGLLDSSPAIIRYYEAIRNEQGQIVDFTVRMGNNVRNNSHGPCISKLIGQPLTAHFPNFVTTDIFARYVAVVDTRLTDRFETYYDADGIRGWFDCTAVANGDGLVVTALDITASRAYQLELEQKNRELKRSNQALEQFAYIASHDLQEPLRKIETFGDLLLLQHSGQLGSTGTDLLRRMQTAAHRMSGMIRDLLQYSRTITLQRSADAIDLNILVKQLIAEQEATIQEKQATIQLSALPTVRGDLQQFRQLFHHLIDNALKFNRSQTAHSVEIAARKVCGIALKERYPEANASAFWEISVRDNGIGFDPKHNERIFQLFQRLHGRSLYEGSGIGLAICKKVVENHQGFIEAHGQPGQGATFTTYLPGD